MCGADDWRSPGALGNLLAFVPTVTLDGQPVSTSTSQGGFTAYMWACGRCGFVRMHATAYLDPESRERGG